MVEFIRIFYFKVPDDIAVFGQDIIFLELLEIIGLLESFCVEKILLPALESF